MKLTMIILSTLVGLFIIFQIYTTMSTGKSQTQPYTLIKTEKDFEIRFYPSVTIASITSGASSYKELGSNGFKTLAGYIFGSNDANKKIAMTTPVQMDINDTNSRMSFVMPAEYNRTNLPKPNNKDVLIQTTNPEYVAAINFSGFASDAKIREYGMKLEKQLLESGIHYHGTYRFLGYNPPYQLIARRNEVIVTIDWPKDATY